MPKPERNGSGGRRALLLVGLTTALIGGLFVASDWNKTSTWVTCPGTVVDSRHTYLRNIGWHYEVSYAYEAAGKKFSGHGAIDCKNEIAPTKVSVYYDVHAPSASQLYPPEQLGCSPVVVALGLILILMSFLPWFPDQP
jgi:hypothetical protein